MKKLVLVLLVLCVLPLVIAGECNPVDIEGSCFDRVFFCESNPDNLPPEMVVYFNALCSQPKLPPNEIPEFPLVGGAAIPFGLAALGYIIIRKKSK